MTGPKNRPRYGEWLREQCQAQGWDVPEMARRLREAAQATGDDDLPSPESVTVMIYRWEGNRSGISERNRLLFCRALGILPAEFGKPANDAPPSGDSPEALMLALAEETLEVVASVAADLAARIRKLRCNAQLGVTALPAECHARVEDTVNRVVAGQD